MDRYQDTRALRQGRGWMCQKPKSNFPSQWLPGTCTS